MPKKLALKNPKRSKRGKQDVSQSPPDGSILESSVVAIEKFGEALNVLQLLDFRERVPTDSNLGDKVLLKIEVSLEFTRFIIFIT